MMLQFRSERNQYGNIRIFEMVRRSWGMTWVEVALRQIDSRTGKVTQ
jgi:hypothetical protein